MTLASKPLPTSVMKFVSGEMTLLLQSGPLRMSVDLSQADQMIRPCRIVVEYRHVYVCVASSSSPSVVSNGVFGGSKQGKIVCVDFVPGLRRYRPTVRAPIAVASRSPRWPD